MLFKNATDEQIKEELKQQLLWYIEDDIYYSDVFENLSNEEREELESATWDERHQQREIDYQRLQRIVEELFNVS